MRVGMASRHPQRRPWSEWLQLALLQVALLLALLFALVGDGRAHPGGVDGEGCHTRRQTGERHCHGGATLPKAAVGSGTPARLVADAAARPVRFANCAEARAAGAAPIRRGTPGYATHLDRDGDGIACEPPRGR
jgi:hypothetical protein